MDNNVGTITLSTEVDTKGVDKGLVDIERKVTGKGFMNKFSRMFSGIFSKASSGASKLTSSINKGMTSIIKDIGSIASGVSGIGTIIAAISLVGIIGMVALAAAKSEEARQQLEQIANIIIGIIDALGNLLLPIAETIVDWIYKAVGIFGIFLKDILGIDLATKSVSNNMKKTIKSAKELRKQLLGFDEMNILNKDGTTGALGGLGGNGSKTTTKDYGIYNDMSGLNKGLADLGVVAVYTGDDLKETRLQLEQLIADVKNGKATMTKSNGMITITNKAGRAIKLTTKEYEKLLDDINHSRVTSRNLDIWWKIRGAFQDWNTNQFREEFNNALVFAKNGLEGAVVSYEGNMVKVRLATGQTFTFTKEQWEKMNEVAKKSAEGTQTNWFNSATSIIDKFTSNTQKGVLGAVIGTFDKINSASNKDSDETKTHWFDTATSIIDKYTNKGKEGVVGAITSGLNAIPQSTETNTKSALNVVNDMINKFRPPSKKVDIIAQLDTSKMMATLRKMAKSWPMAFQPIVSALEKQGFAKGGIVGIPRLAKGGIINRPGRGVPLAIGGEISKEGVIPMDNQSQMQLLGREIAKYISVNLTNVTELDGRVIARNVTQVMNDMNFASNGGVI